MPHQPHDSTRAALASTSHPADILIADANVQAVIDASLDSIIFISEDGVICACNTATEKLFGYTPRELLCGDISLLMPEPYASRHHNFIRAYLASGQAFVIGIGREVEGKHKHGNTFPLHLSINEFRYRGKRFFAGFLRDLRKQKDNEHERESMQHLLEQRVRKRTEEMASAYMRLQQETLQREIAVTNTRLLLTSLRKSRAAQADSHREPLHCSVIECAGLTAQALADILPANVHVDIHIADPSLPRARLPGDVLQQILLNLCSNAQTAIRQAGSITIGISAVDTDAARCCDACGSTADRHALRVDVRDTGCGLNEDIRQQLFNHHGTGLGMQVIDTLLHEYGGHITVDSSPAGSCLSLWLPVAPTAADDT